MNEGTVYVSTCEEHGSYHATETDAPPLPAITIYGNECPYCKIERINGLLKKARVLLDEAEFYLAANGCKYPTREIQAYLKEDGDDEER